MTRLFRMLAILLPTTVNAITPIVAAPLADPSVGIRTMIVPAPARGKPIEANLWYPAEAGGVAEIIGGGKVFEGVEAVRDATLAGSGLPLVLMAHGGLRSAPHLSGWIASALAGRGFVVAVVRPPMPEQPGAENIANEAWLRSADLSAALDAFGEDTNLSAHLDLNRVAAVGFLMGGTSALALAGARFDANSYMASCDGANTGLDCAWFDRIGVDLHNADAAQLAGSHEDLRIKAVAVVDPELSSQFTQESLAGMTVPVQIINLGRSDNIPTELDAADLATAIPNARFDRITDASRYSSFSACTEQGRKILQADGDGALCRDGSGRSRADIQAQIAAIIAEHFGRHLLVGAQ